MSITTKPRSQIDTLQITNQMVGKLFTPLTLGAFDLRHRLLCEGFNCLDPMSERLTIDRDRWLDRTADHDHMEQARTLALPSTSLECEDESIRYLNKKSRETVRVRRLSVDQADTAGFGDGVIERAIHAHIELAQFARKAGYDGIEIDGSTGTILDAFFRLSGSSSGAAGNPTNPVTIASYLVDALTTIFDRDRIGLRLNPFNAEYDKFGVRSSYVDVMRAVGDLEIGYVNIPTVKAVNQAATQVYFSDFAAALRRAFPGVIVASEMTDLEQAIALIEARWADAVCFDSQALPSVLSQIEELACDRPF